MIRGPNGERGLDYDGSQFVISEYMSGSIVKVADEPQASQGVISGDIIGYTITYRNVGNTGMYFQIGDTLSQYVNYVNSYSDITLDPNWNLSIPATPACGGL